MTRTQGSLQRWDDAVGRALAAALPTAVHDGVLAYRQVSVVFDVVGRGRWVVRTRFGTVSVDTRIPARPTATITADPAAVTALLAGRCSLVSAFLTGALRVRGSMSTVLALGGVLAPAADLPTRARVRETSVFGVRTGYLDAGPPGAPPVVLLHGLGATNASILPVLADLAAEHRVLAPDLPGFGSSAAPNWDYDPVQLQRWLRAFLDTVDAPASAVIGHSLGGRVALELALRNPETVRSLVLLCPALAFRRRQLTALARRIPADLARLPIAFPHRLLHEGTRGAYRTLFADPDRVPLHWFDAAADEWELTLRDTGHRRALWSATLGLYLDEPFGDRGLWNRVAQLAVPTLCVWGADDPLVPARFADHLTATAPQVRSVTLPDCGHLPQFEWPEATGALIDDFLTRTARHPRTAATA
ncbi:alpha/beta fold hydrolase [Rhodococcus jostii]|uniref:alpha/beta fold hydrolase n=1 Tax=Rhodococcus jostii TaxID=132919 RepID=UPI003669BEF9